MLAQLRPKHAKYNGGVTEIRMTLLSHAERTCVESDIEIVMVHSTTPPSVQIRLGEPLTAEGETPREAAAKFGRWLTRLGEALTLLAPSFPDSAAQIPWVISDRAKPAPAAAPPDPQPEFAPCDPPITDADREELRRHEEIVKSLMKTGP